MYCISGIDIDSDVGIAVVEEIGQALFVAMHRGAVVLHKLVACASALAQVQAQVEEAHGTWFILLLAVALELGPEKQASTLVQKAWMHGPFPQYDFEDKMLNEGTCRYWLGCHLRRVKMLQILAWMHLRRIQMLQILVWMTSKKGSNAANLGEGSI